MEVCHLVPGRASCNSHNHTQQVDACALSDRKRGATSLHGPLGFLYCLDRPGEVLHCSALCARSLVIAELESCTKPTIPADGRAFQPVWGCYTGYTCYIGCSISPLSQPTRRGATLLRHAHGDLVIAESAPRPRMVQIMFAKAGPAFVHHKMMFARAKER